MKKKFFVGLRFLILGFFLLFILRLMYGYFSTSSALVSGYSNIDYSSGSTFEFGRKNYASAKFKSEGGPSNLAPVDQKYEKVGSLTSKTNDFESDEKSVRSLISHYSALIQFEQNSGLKGRRTLHLGIGVVPDKFDEMIVDLKKIGKLSSIRIDKADKTNEYKDLKAKRISLEKTRDALIGLKGKGGKIEELIKLEDRILEIEKEIQSMGVKLGEFDAENEFCTVKMTLEEDGIKKGKISLAHRLKVAFEWTVKFYLALVGVIFLGSLAILIIVLILEKLKWIPTATENFLKDDKKG